MAESKEIFLEYLVRTYDNKSAVHTLNRQSHEIIASFLWVQHPQRPLVNRPKLLPSVISLEADTVQYTVQYTIQEKLSRETVSLRDIRQLSRRSQYSKHGSFYKPARFIMEKNKLYWQDTILGASEWKLK